MARNWSEYMSKTFKIGTRASVMAVRQTEAVLQALRERFPEHTFEMVTRPADADLDLKSRLGAMGGKGGAFIKAMHDMVLAGEADMVMHSLKDLPGNDEYYENTTFSIGACLPRSDPRDAMVLKANASAAAGGTAASAAAPMMPVPTVIGTASVRRKAFLKRLFPAAQVVPFRGAADKRIARLDGGVAMEFNYGGSTPLIDALVLAKSGLERIDLGHRVSRVFTPEEMCPAVGQGVVVVEYASGNAEVKRILSAINDRLTMYCYQAEREVLRVLNGHCDSPIAAHAWIDGGRLKLKGVVIASDGNSMIEAYDETDSAHPSALGARVGLRLNTLGAQTIIDETRFID